MAKFKITTLGCKVNQSESDALAKELESAEWLPAHDSESSEICIINTCTVTQKAAMQSRQAVRQAIRANPNSQIVVTGCYAQTEPKAIEDIDGVSYVIGNADKHRISKVILSDKNTAPDQVVSMCNDIRQAQSFNSTPGFGGGNRSRPFLKIQDGCNSFCSYCIVPYARGPSRSMSVENVLEEIKALSTAGYQEIVLSGIHLGHYGRDLIPASNLCELLDLIDNAHLIQRVRLSSIEPLELVDDIIQRVADSHMFCHHFHIPLQSGDDGILKNMGRPYTAKDFRQVASHIRDRLPDAAIGVDTLIGFPGETDEAFENTYEVIRDLPITYLHVFPFSARPGTPAARYPDQVASKVIKKRCEQMRNLGNAKRNHFYSQHIGKEIEVLIEAKRHLSSGLLKGVSSNYIPVLIEADDEYKNKLMTVRAQKLTGDNLLGTILS